MSFEFDSCALLAARSMRIDYSSMDNQPFGAGALQLSMYMYPKLHMTVISRSCCVKMVSQWAQNTETFTGENNFTKLKFVGTSESRNLTPRKIYNTIFPIHYILGACIY